MRQRIRRLMVVLAVAVWAGSVLALGAVGFGRTISLLRQPLDSPDFATYYLAARMLDVEPTSIYDIAALNTLASGDGPRQAFVYTYPPFFAAAMRPLARLPYAQAVNAWLVLETLCVATGAAGLLALTRWPGGPRGTIVVLALLLLFTPLHEAILLGQVSPLLFVLTALALLLLQPGKPAHDLAAGALLGVAVLIKIVPAVLLLYLLFRRRWLAVLGGVGGGSLCLLAGLLWGGGWANTWAYFTVHLPAMYTRYMEFVHLGNQSLTASFLRPLGSVPLANALGTGAVLLVATVTGLALLLRHPPRLSDEYALVSLLPLLVVSGVYSHMYVLILLPIALLAESAYNGRRWTVGPLMLAYLLLIVNSYSEWLGLRVAIWLPFGLVGTLLVWGMTCYQVLRPSDGRRPASA